MNGGEGARGARRPPARHARAVRRHPLAPRPSFLVPLFLLAACTRGTAVDAPAPTVAATEDTLPPLPPSNIEAPLVYDYAGALGALESLVPREFGDIDKRTPIPSNSRASFAFAAVREPFAVTVDGNTAIVTAVIKYKGKAWYDPPIGPELTGSCGLDQYWPRARIQIASTVEMSSDWRLHPKTVLRKVEPYSDDRADECKVTMLHIDVTEKVMDATRAVLAQQLPKVDAKIAALDVRTPLEHIWAQVQRPIRLTDSVWLLIRPTGVRLGDITSERRAVVGAVGLTATPRVVTGPRPDSAILPLPRLQHGEVGNGVHVLAEGTLTYDVANAILDKELKGKRIKQGDHELVIKELRLSGIGNGRVALRLTFGGATSGRFYFVGTPRYDSATRELVVPDLDYDVGSAIVLVKGLDWLKHDDIRDFFRSHARVPVGDIMERLEDLMQKNMNRKLGEKVQLVADVKEVSPLGVYATRHAVLVRARAECTGKLIVEETPRVARR